MLRIIFLLLAMLPLPALAQACIIHAHSDSLDVKLCQHNRSIPPTLFKNGFCQPRLAGQKTEVSFSETCPGGAFGVCRNAQTAGGPYQQDIYYYGVASDARYLRPACEQQNRGTWMDLQ